MYNVAKYIKTCIDSILTQSYKNIELRQLGKSILEQNYKIPSYLYICYYNDNYKFSLSNGIYNQAIRSNDIFFAIINHNVIY